MVNIELSGQETIIIGMKIPIQDTVHVKDIRTADIGWIVNGLIGYWMLSTLLGGFFSYLYYFWRLVT